MNHSVVDLLIIGMGGNSLEVYERIKFQYPEKRIGFLDDKVFNDLVVGKFSEITEFPSARKLFMVGSPKSFKSREQIFKNLDFEIDTLDGFIDPISWISASGSIGIGSVVMRNSYIGRNVRLGINSIVLPNVFIGHDSTVDDFTVISANVSIAGEVKLGRQCYIGTNATIRDGVSIGDNCLIGAGAVVISDVPDNCTYVGNPARLISSKR